MSTTANKVDNYQTQVAELEALQSIYPDELTIMDHGVLADINTFVSGVDVEISLPLEYVVDIPDVKGNWQLYVTLPSDYPSTKPDVYVRSDSLDRLSQSNFNKCLSNVVLAQEDEQPCIYFLILWVQENIEKYLNSSKLKKTHKSSSSSSSDNRINERIDRSFSRYWIYSHHILSKIKRKEILEIAKENNITGFCLAGKPGIICIEGVSEECEDWWQRIRALNWQKILVKLKEEEPLQNDDIDSYRKFPTFQEIAFPSHDCHNNMGELYKYLTEHNVQYVFKEYFGVEGKPSSI